ncbi:MAG TPA: hypothetical protein VHU19_06580 [Pyrinomonadaceae bacterium]|jgi:hypothetical protein|nr:hypothetical protein [Pyrinomonadaceae bacterium]
MDLQKLTKNYQILKVVTHLSEEARRVMDEAPAYYVERGRFRLIYVEPKDLDRVTGELGIYGARGFVLADYLLTDLIYNGTKVGFSVVDVELANNRMFRTLTRTLIGSGRWAELRELLEGAKEPITAVELEYEGFKLKLYGSGIISVNGPAREFEFRIKEILERVTDCLSESLEGVESGHALAVSAANMSEAAVR